LTNANVAAELEKLRARQERRSERKLEHVLNELDNLAFTGMPNFAGLLAAADPVEHLRTMDPEKSRRGKPAPQHHARQAAGTQGRGFG
jgi:hypothetical protein